MPQLRSANFVLENADLEGSSKNPTIWRSKAKYDTGQQKGNKLNFVPGASARLPQAIQACADDVALVVNGGRFILINAADTVVRSLPSKAGGAKIVTEIFDLDAPVLCKHPLHAAARRPSGNEFGEAVSPDPTSREIGEGV